MRTAIAPEGHDKEHCGAFVYGPETGALGRRYGTPFTGCGLCQTRVP
jgi:hypothetical protein